MSAPTVTPHRQRSAAQAPRDPARVLTPLASRSDEACLREAYRHTSTSSAPGIDGVTARRSAAPRDEHLRDVQARLRRGRSQAAPVERVWIAQDEGGPRPIGKPAVEDQRVQRAVARRWAALDEQEVYDGSDGVRQGRSPPEALQELRQRCLTEGRGGRVEADVRGDCASMDSTRGREVLRQRGNAGRVRRRIGQWLRAGGLAPGALPSPEPGGVQGGVLAPVLAKVVLHHGLDAWCDREGQPRMQGRGCLRRLAEDLGIGCAHEGDARKRRAVLPKRCARVGRTLHPTQTAVMACRQPEAHQGADRGHGPGTCRGLTPYGTPSRRGCWVRKRRTAHTRLRRTTQALGRWGRSKRHAPLQDPSQRLGAQRRGPCQYDGMQGHFRLLEEGRRVAERAGRYWLRRRRRKSTLQWEKCETRMRTSIRPIPRIVHPI